VQVGRVTAVYWEGGEAAAVALAEMASEDQRWPGIAARSERPLRIILVSSDAQFDSLTRGRVPSWGAAATFPASRTIILNRSPDLPRILRHELAHLALHEAVRRVPRWFDEGYASRAAGEWDRMEALRVNLALLRGRAPSLAELDRRIRAGTAGEAEASYALATTAVLLLERLGGDRGLEPLIRALGGTADFDLALRATYQLTLGQFEARWHQELRSRYGWLLVLSSVTLFWAFAALVLVALWSRRRRRDEARRAALDEGWTVPGDPWHPDA
jgi:MYXO-CTERM domain-containing protein